MNEEKRSLILAIGIKTNQELMNIMAKSTPESKDVAKEVILKGKTYEEAGKIRGKKKQAVYELMKRIYYNKYKKNYRGTDD